MGASSIIMPDSGNVLSGNAAFDAKTGGFRRGSVVLFSGSPDSGVGSFAAGALANALSEGGGGAIVLTTQGVSDFKKAAYKRGLFFAKFESAGNLWFLDAYSRLVGGKAEPARLLGGPSDLKGIVLNVADINSQLFRKGLPAVFLIDSFSGLAVHNSGGMLVKFLDELGAILKRTDSTLFIVLYDMPEEPSLLADIAQHADVHVTLYREGDATFARLRGSGQIELFKGAV